MNYDQLISWLENRRLYYVERHRDCAPDLKNYYFRQIEAIEDLQAVAEIEREQSEAEPR